MSKVTKWQKDKLQELADEQMFLPGLDYFVGKQRGMYEMANYARPRIEQLLLTRRQQAVDAINTATSDIQNQYKEALNKRTRQITAATAATFLKALAYDDTNNLGLKKGVLVRNRDTGIPMHVLPTQKALFSNNKTDKYFPQNTYDEGKSVRTIGNAFEAAYNHANNRLNKIQTQASYTNPHNREFPIYRGSDDPDTNDGSTGELEGVYKGMPVLLSRFTKVPIRGILQDMADKLDITPSQVPPPTLTFRDPDTMLTDITEADIDTVLG